MKLPNQIGLKYGRLTIKSFSRIEKNRKFYLCKCDCGKEHTVCQDNLRSGLVKSCGCLKIEKSKISITHGMRNSRIYNIYAGIKQRCNNINCSNYKNYGGRGIKCEWKSFEDFYEDMGLLYQDGLQIDRKDNDGNYCKNNCKWSTRSQQQNNKRNTLKFNGESLSELCTKYNLPYAIIYARIHTYGFSIERAIKQKIKSRK